MLSSSIITTRKTRSTNIHFNSIDESTIFDNLHSNLHSSIEFIRLYKEYSEKNLSQTTLINILCHCLLLENIENQIILFIFDCFIENYEYLTEIQFKQNLLPYIKQIFTSNHDLSLSIIRLLIILIEHRSNILTSTIVEWLSCLFNFLVTNLSSITYIIYKDLIIDLLKKILQQFIPLSKEIIDILARSSIISTNFLNQLKIWIKNSDDIHLALFSIHLWQILATLFSRLLIRGHTKGNEILSVIEDAFIVSNYSIRSEAFHIWSIFILNIHQIDDSDLLKNRLLKLFLTPFLSDSTSKSKLASISKCHAWITLIKIYPKHIHDIILPFLSFAFGNHLSSNNCSTTTAWWIECRQIGGEFLQKFLIENIHSEYMIKLASDQILNYLFDSILDQLLEYKINSEKILENSLWLKSWNAYLNHLMNIFKLNNLINEKQRIAINNCLLTRIEQFWIDSRIETRFLLKLFETFEQISFPLAIETVLCDSNIRTKTLSAAQIHPSSTNHKSQEKSSNYRTTLSDQYLHMMLEHAIRFNDEDQTIEECYLHVLTYLIDTLSKTSDENFCYQTSSLLLKCSVEYTHQPLIIPYLFWHIWSRCSIHITNILNCSHTFELNNNIDNQKQETSIELLLRPFAFNDIQRLDYSYTLIWIQLFKSLCRLTLINNNEHLINLFIELLRNEPAFKQAINTEHNQRLFGFILIILKTLLKTFSNIDLIKILDRSNNLFSTIHKRSSSSFINLCFTQFSIIINHILQRLLSNNENNIQYILVCHCLLKSIKISSNEQQIKIFIFTYIRDLIIDLFNLCKTYVHLEIIFQNLIHLIPFLYLYEQQINSSSILKQQIDNVILNKILTIINLVFQPNNSSSLLQIIYPILILAFQHHKTMIRNKARKCWNETFGRLTFIVYPNELRLCLQDLKDKEHLLLPCFLADHDNSNTAGSGPIPSSTDESQLSQQIDIPTPFISSMISQQKPSLSPARILPSSNRSINFENNESIFVPIIKNQTNSPNIIGKRLSSKNSCLTEKQKEKLHIRDSIPLICDDNSNIQSNSCTSDTKMNQSEIENKEIKTNLTIFNQTIINPIQENISEESSITNKLRHSSRSSISARKSLRKKLSISSTLTSSSTINNSSIEQIQKFPIKSILKRLSPTKSRQEHKRHVVFHDQVKVLVFASPSYRDLIVQQKRKDDLKSPTKIISKENLPLRKQPMSARRLSVMNNIEQIIPSSPINSNKIRSSKLFHPNDALADWTQNQVSDPIFPNLINCEKSIDCLMNFVYDGLCPHDVRNYFYSNKLHTIGDIARLTSSQIENSPIPSPKLINIQKAFSLYQKHLINPLSISSTTTTTMINSTSTISLIPISSTSNETIPIDDNISTISETQNKLYDVDKLIDSLDCEKLYLNDNQKEFHSPHKRCLSPTNENNQFEENNEISPKKQIISNLTLGDYLQKAADIYQIKGNLPFNDDYIELIRQLFNNSSLTHLEKLHLKTLVLND